MSGGLLDTVQHTLRPLACKRSAQVACIIRGLPDSTLAVAGHMDSVHLVRLKIRLYQECELSLRRRLMIAFQASMSTRTTTARPIEMARSRGGMATVLKMCCAAGM